jgi:hypothetical protein
MKAEYILLDHGDYNRMDYDDEPVFVDSGSSNQFQKNRMNQTHPIATDGLQATTLCFHKPIYHLHNTRFSRNDGWQFPAQTKIYGGDHRTTTRGLII